MKKSGDKDFLTVLQSLETILQAQTKISKQQLSSRTQNSKASSSPKKSNKKKMMKMDFQENDKNKEFNKIPLKSPSSRSPRKLYKNSKNKQLFMTPVKYSRYSSPKNQKKTHHTLSPQIIKKDLMHSPQSSIKQQKRRVRHNSPSDQIQYNNNTDDYPYLSQNYTSSQLNTLCIFFLRWMKRCTEKIEAESNKKSNSQSNQVNTLYDKKSMEKAESNINVQNRSSKIPKTLAESDEISIERIKCNPDEQTNQIPFDKIEINITPKSFKSSHPSSFNSVQKSNKKSDGQKKNSSKVKFNPSLTPQQEKQNIDYLHSNHSPNHSSDNSTATKNNQKKISSRKVKDNDIEIENVKNRNNDINANNNSNSNDIQQASVNSTNKNTNDGDKNTNIDNNNEANDNNNANENIKNNNSNDENLTKDNTKYNNQDTDNNVVNANSNNINQNSSTSNVNLDSTEDICKLDLEETSPLPKPNEVRKMPSIGESDLNNQPNSEDIHYDSYELSEKSLSLLPPRGEGEVTDFNPSNL